MQPHKQTKNPLLMGRSDPEPVILHVEACPLALCLRPNANMGSDVLLGEFKRIIDQVGNNLRENWTMSPGAGQRSLDLDDHVLGCDFNLELRQDLPHRRFQIEERGGALGLAEPAIVQ